MVEEDASCLPMPLPQATAMEPRTRFFFITSNVVVVREGVPRLELHLPVSILEGGGGDGLRANHGRQKTTN